IDRTDVEQLVVYFSGMASTSAMASTGFCLVRQSTRKRRLTSMAASFSHGSVQCPRSSHFRCLPDGGRGNPGAIRHREGNLFKSPDRRTRTKCKVERQPPLLIGPSRYESTLLLIGSALQFGG